jgi:hypothetical protein
MYLGTLKQVSLLELESTTTMAVLKSNPNFMSIAWTMMLHSAALYWPAVADTTTTRWAQLFGDTDTEHETRWMEVAAKASIEKVGT